MKITKYSLIFLHLLIGISASFGGYKLITDNGMGIPIRFLEGSPFSNYFYPGLILLIVVGFGNLIAAKMHILKIHYANEVSLAAGFSIMIFEFVELYIVKHPFWLQLAYFSLGIITVCLTMNLYRARGGEKK